APETIDQDAKRPRADVLAPDKPQPVATFFVVQTGGSAAELKFLHLCPHTWKSAAPIANYSIEGEAVFSPILVSVPRSSRAIFSRCLTHRATVRTAKNMALLISPPTESRGGVAKLATSAESEE